MRKVQEDSVLQDRWNQYGTEVLEKLENNPERYVIHDCPIRRREMTGKVAELIGPLQGKRILELGCGLGKFSVWLAKQGAKVVAMDIGSDLVVAARALARINQVECEFRQGNTVALPFGSDSYDIVIGLAILHHLSTADVLQTLQECHRVLKINGKAVFYEPVENSKLFNLIQNLFPAGERGSRYYRPSILQRKAWKHYVEALDDRDMTNQELISAGLKFFRGARTYPYGFLIRLTRLIGKNHHNALENLDRLLFKRFPPLRHYSQAVLVDYQK